MLELNLVNLFYFSFLENWSSALNQLEQAPGKSEGWLMKDQLHLLGSVLLIGYGWEVCFQSRSRANVLLWLHRYVFLTNGSESSWMSFLFQWWSCEGLHCISTHTNKWTSAYTKHPSIAPQALKKLHTCMVVFPFTLSMGAVQIGHLASLVTQALKSTENLCILVQAVLFPLLKMLLLIALPLSFIQYNPYW